MENLNIEVIAVTFYGQTFTTEVAENEYKEVLNYECMFTLKVNGTQVVLNASGNEDESNYSFNFEDGDHQADDDFCRENTAHEIGDALEKQHGWENNFYYLKENSTLQF